MRDKREQAAAASGSAREDAGSPKAAERITVDAESAVTGPLKLPTDGEGSGKKRARKRFSWANLTYTTRVTVAFACIAAMTALVAIGVLSFVWEQHFQTYTQQNMEKLAESTAEQIAEVYQETGRLDDPGVIAAALYAEKLNGVGVKIVDNQDGSTVYDSTMVGDEQGRRGKLGSDQGSLAPPPGARDQLAIAKIVSDNVAVGSVHMWVYGSEALLRQTDEAFRDNSYQAMMFATVLAILLASCIGFLFARTLVAPINRMTKTAKAIKEGDLNARTQLHGEDEIARLGETFDEMADSIERDRELERRLTTDVAHELRTPLMAIQSTVEAMVDGVFEADPEHLETVNSEVQRLSRLVDSLLKLSRLENRSTPMKTEVVDVGKLIAGIIATHEAFVADSGLTLEYQMEPGVRVVGDADMIRQATANLISNAVRYTPEGGHITVRVKRGDIMASIAVQDTGIGLSPEEAKMVFSRFWRADAGRTRESGGLGVGLAVVKEIVERHNGWVQVEGRKGAGACFTIHIPLYHEEHPQKGTKTQRSRGKSRKDAK
ncbi:sensor histidine kinase [Arabiibacter massiliensis]|uniref:sensor histidine kinase n=1 Tax=Arabiibacter massiliensis TaxID=1870985 RepID=UPI0009BB30EF|nr:HAMP domain-containing sensor histidine kinase [Arabiibacter massiliensis]